MMDAILKATGAVVLFVVGVAALATIGAYPTKWIVNYLFTSGTLMALFGVAKLTFWKALWLNVFCGWLIKGTTTVSK